MMSSSDMIERDVIVSLGILARAYVDFDPPISGAAKAPHSKGFNVHCIVLDNRDGEVLAVARNRIYADEDPLQHAEQVGIRAAMTRLKQKRPRLAGRTVVDYYKGDLFMEPGIAESDFASKRCTLYNTFDPCGFCATTSLVCYMKRVAYLFEDEKFSGVYDLMKEKYFVNRDSIKQSVQANEKAEGFIGEASRLLISLRSKVDALAASGTDLVQTLDHCRDDLAQASSLLAGLKSAAIAASGREGDCNRRSLQDIQRLVLGV